MFDALSNVDIETVNDRMYDVYDEIPSSKQKYSVLCIAYGNYENHDKIRALQQNTLLDY
jgi:hypothetical protein